MEVFRQYQAFQSLLPKINSWCLRNPIYCARLAAILGNLGVLNPGTIVLIMKNKEPILSLLQYLVKDKKYKKIFQNFFVQQIGLNRKDFISTQALELALNQKLQKACLPNATFKSPHLKQVCLKAQSELKNLVRIIQPFLK